MGRGNPEKSNPEKSPEGSAWLPQGMSSGDRAASNGNGKRPDATNGSAPASDGSGEQSHSNGAGASDVARWLDAASSNSVREARPRPLSDRRDRGRTPRERWLASRLRRAREKLDAQEGQIAELKARIEELERARRSSA